MSPVSAVFVPAVRAGSFSIVMKAVQCHESCIFTIARTGAVRDRSSVRGIQLFMARLQSNLLKPKGTVERGVCRCPGSGPGCLISSR